MRSTRLMSSAKVTTFALLGTVFIASTGVARAQYERVAYETGGYRADGYVMDGLGTGRDPVSTRASNIVASDARSPIAPALPSPDLGTAANPRDYVRAAREALASGRTGEAQQSLEMAETRELTRVVSPDAANDPDPDPAVNQIRHALHALGEGDRARALDIIDAMAR